MGLTGEIGLAGDCGLTGELGLTGEIGLTGLFGDNGEIGETWLCALTAENAVIAVTALFACVRAGSTEDSAGSRTCVAGLFALFTCMFDC